MELTHDLILYIPYITMILIFVMGYYLYDGSRRSYVHSQCVQVRQESLAHNCTTLILQRLSRFSYIFIKKPVKERSKSNGDEEDPFLLLYI